MNRGDFVAAILRRLDDPSVREQWASPSGTSTKHFVVDDLFPEEWADAIYEAFPRDGASFGRKESFKESKSQSGSLKLYPEILSQVTFAFQDPAVVAKVEEITGIRGLEPDPMLYAGGLSMMFKNDFLNPHIDNSHDLRRQRYRRLNLLYYVSPDWRLESGGNFELWDDSGKVAKTFVSIRNRLLVMNTNKRSLHSVSPVRADRSRCCVSNYYFSKESPTGEDYFHVTSFWGRPEQKALIALGHIDNLARNFVAKTFGLGTGRKRVNTD
jgi:Rps23 Pro-64 3,4-dihydroxylase Tpa1-like proline 4-hydroxylase